MRVRGLNAAFDLSNDGAAEQTSRTPCSFSSTDFFRIFVKPQTQKLRFSQATFVRPFCEANLRDQWRYTQRMSFISSAATPPSQREDPLGKWTNGHSFEWSGTSVLMSSRRTSGINPALTFPAKRSLLGWGHR